jgi:chaperonin GroEL
VNATKAALEEGIVAGGGTPLAKIANVMTDKMFKNALVTPLRQMAINAGMNPKKVIRHVQNLNNFDKGYDFKARKLSNLIENGIIDPVKVTRLALESAISIASTMITADVAMVDVLEK